MAQDTASVPHYLFTSQIAENPVVLHVLQVQTQVASADLNQ